MRGDLPRHRAVQARGRHRRLRPRALHRLQGVPERLPLRRALHRPQLAHGREVQLLRPPGRRGTQAGVRGRLPDQRDRLRRPRRPRVARCSQLIDVIPHEVRAPEQGTGPNVFYLGAEEASLNPLQVGGGDGFIYSEVPPAQQEKLAPLTEDAEARAMHDIDHPAPWGWKVSSYFLTKGIAAGAMMLAGVCSRSREARSAGVLAPRGDRRHRRLPRLRPQAAAPLLLPVHAAAVALLARARRAGHQRRGLVAFAFTVCAAARLRTAPRDVLRWVMVPAGALLAAYTAFLFNQCEGRDLWQSRAAAAAHDRQRGRRRRRRAGHRRAVRRRGRRRPCGGRSSPPAWSASC